MEKCKICGSDGVFRIYENVRNGIDHYVRCSDDACVNGPSRNTKEEAEAAWNELMRVQPVEAVRKPVGICAATLATKTCVICDDGSVFAMNPGDGIGRVTWFETDPIPGTAADLARGLKGV